MNTNERNAWGNPAMDKHPIQWEVEILQAAPGYQDKLQPDGPLGL